MVNAVGTVYIAHDRKTCFGASPFWDSDVSALIYVDVTKRSIYRYFPKRCEIHKFKDEEVDSVAFAIPLQGCPEDYIVGADNQLKLLRWSPDKTTEIFRQHGGEESLYMWMPSGQVKETGSERGQHLQSQQLSTSPVQIDDRTLESIPTFDPLSIATTSSENIPRIRHKETAIKSIPAGPHDSSSCHVFNDGHTMLGNEAEEEAMHCRVLETSSSREQEAANISVGTLEKIPTVGCSDIQDGFGGGSTGGCTEDEEETEGTGGEWRRDDAGETVSVSSGETDGYDRVKAGYGSCEKDEPVDSQTFEAPDCIDQEALEGQEASEDKPFEAEDVTIATLDEPEGNYYKTAKVDTCGRLWTGTSGPQNGEQVGCVEEAGLGNIYGVTWQRELRVKIPSISQSSGMVWSPDNRTLYILDAAESCIFAYDFHEKTGTVSSPRAIFDTAILGRGVVPHGITIDNDGYLYVGIYGLGKVIIVDPETRKLAGYICIPTPYVTGVTWGGEMLDTLYVTTAALQADLSRHPKSGSLFQITDLRAKGFKNLKANIIP